MRPKGPRPRQWWVWQLITVGLLAFNLGYLVLASLPAGVSTAQIGLAMLSLAAAITLGVNELFGWLWRRRR